MQQDDHQPEPKPKNQALISSSDKKLLKNFFRMFGMLFLYFGIIVGIGFPLISQCFDNLHNLKTWQGYGYDHDGEEGFILNQAHALKQGDSIYQPIDEAPWLVGNYPPVFPLILSITIDSRPSPESMQTARTITVWSGNCAFRLSSTYSY